MEAGKRDRLIAVELDCHVPNVEERLVSGVDASRSLDPGSWVHERGAVRTRASGRRAGQACARCIRQHGQIAVQWKQLNYSAPPDFRAR